jgi:hypothetical protein
VVRPNRFNLLYTLLRNCGFDGGAIWDASYCSPLTRGQAVFELNCNCRGRELQEGLYKVEFHTVHGTGSGVIYATCGKLRGGNSAFAFIGNYSGVGDAVRVKVSTRRHNDDPSFNRCSAPT